MRRHSLLKSLIQFFFFLIEEGATYYFKVNDVPIFAKGSNEIPIDILPERGQDRQKIRYLLESAVEVNMNMLRVWGGGEYFQIKTVLYSVLYILL